MAIVKKADLENARVDVQTIADVTNGTATRPNPGHPDGTVTSRLGQTIPTMSKVADTIFQAAFPDAVMQVELFDDIPATYVPSEYTHIRTSGHSTLGHGGAFYVRTERTGLTAYRTQSLNGVWWELSTDAPPNIDQFGARGYNLLEPAIGSPFDSADAIQAALDWQAERGGGAIQSGSCKRYFLSKSVKVDPARSTHFGNGAWWDWSIKAFADPASAPELLSNGGFDSGSTGWTLGSGSGTTNAFSRGYAAFTTSGLQMVVPLTIDTNGDGDGDVYDADATGQVYLEAGQKIVAGLGSTVKITFTVDYVIPTRVQVTAPGASTPKESTAASMIVLVGTSRDVAGNPKTVTNAGPINSYTVSAADFDPDNPQSVTYTFETVLNRIENTNPWIRIQSNGTARISSISAKVAPDNACLRVFGETDQFGHNRHHWSDLGLKGRNETGYRKFADAVIFDSAQPLSTRVNWFNVQLDNPSFSRGLVFQNGTYLCHFYNCLIMARHRAIDTLPNSRDSGENINFHGGVITSINAEPDQDGCAVANTGKMGLFFFGVSFDFCTTWYKGNGTAEFHSCWFETAAHTDVSKPYWQVDGGTCLVNAGRFQVDNDYFLDLNGDGLDDTDVSPDSFFKVNQGQLVLRDVNCYNLGATSDAFASGDGFFYSTGMKGGGLCPTIGMRRDNMNVFSDGSMENGVGVDFFVDSPGTSGNAKFVYSRKEIGWGAALTFTGDTTLGSDTLTNCSSAISGITVSDAISGPNIPSEAVCITRNTGAGTVQLTQKANKTLASQTFTYTHVTATAGKFKGEVSSDKARTGTQSIKLAKTGGIGPGNGARANFLMKIEGDRRRLGMECYYSMDADPSAPANSKANMFVQGYFIELVDPGTADTPPVIGQTMYAGLDATQVIDRQSGHKVSAISARVTAGTNQVLDVSTAEFELVAVGDTLRWTDSEGLKTATVLSKTRLPAKAGAKAAYELRLTTTASVSYSGAMDVIAASEWNRISYSSLYVDPAFPHNGFPPAWATHFVMRVDVSGFLGDHCTVYFDDFMGSLL